MQGSGGLRPIRRESVPRVSASMALKMADGIYIPMPQPLAGSGRASPIVLNNSCASWHRLAGNFMFGNARAYCGTVCSVLAAEAEAIVERLLGKYFGGELAVALWRAQNDLYEEDLRRPYVLVGCHFQRLRTVGRSDVVGHVIRELEELRDAWQRRVERSQDEETSLRRRIDFVDAELRTHKRFRQRLLESKIRKKRQARRRF